MKNLPRKIAIASWDSGLPGATALPVAMARGNIFVDNWMSVFKSWGLSMQ